MKKSLLLLASLAMSMGAMAQWTKPVPATTVDMDDSGTAAQYLYNKEAVGFFAGANDWGTRASVAAKGDSVRMIKLYEDDEKTVELGTWNFGCYPASYTNKNTWLYVSANGFDAMWVDAGNAAGNASYPGTDLWIVEKQSNGTYKFRNDAVSDATTLGVAEIYQGKKGDTRCYLYNATATYTYEQDGEEIDGGPSFTGAFWDEWVFITPAEYEAMQPKVEQYMAAQSLNAAIENAKAENPSYDYSKIQAVYNNTSSTTEELQAAEEKLAAVLALKKTLDTAKESYPNLDFSAPEAVYNNTSATLEELQAADSQVTTIINDYFSSIASFDEPYDYTPVIGDGSSVDPWTRDFTGTGDVGSHTTNTWSVEADNGADGTDMTTPFIEHWTASGGILSDQKIYQTIKSAAPGLYKLTIDARVYSEAGKLDQFEGIYMYFGDERINLQEETDIFYSGNKSVLWSKDYFTIIAIVKESQDIEFGFDIKDANFNWLAFKNTSLLYYGNKDVEANAAKLLKTSYNLEKADEDTAANPDLIKAYNEAVDAFDAAIAAEDIKNAAKAANTAKVALEANIAAYEKLNEKIDEWNETIATHGDLMGEEWDAFCDFVQMGEVGEGYPSPAPTEIQEGDYSLLTPQIEAYIATVDSLGQVAIARSLKEGDNITYLIQNAGFTDGFTGWTYKGGNVGNFAGLEPEIPNNVEVYSGVVDCYQVLNGMPDGIYSLSCKAFERPAANGSYDGSEPSKVFLFMNDYQTPVQNICKDAIPVDQAEDGVNCYLGGVPYASGAGNTLFDYETAYGYVPNGMVGAAVAFGAGRYNQKVYGLVEGGQMKVGITSNGATAHWVLWADFQLVYEGKSVEALSNILPVYIESLETYLEENQDNMTEAGVDAANAAIEAANKALDDEDAEAMYACITTLNDALAAAKENATAYAALLAAIDEMNIAAENEEIQHSQDAIDRFYNVSDETEEAVIKTLSTEEVIALTEKVKDITAALNIPSDEDASDDNPADFTSVIVNPTFDDGNANGWTYAFEAITNIGYQGANYTNGEDGTTINQFIEGWRSGNNPLGNGSIEQTIAALPVGTYTLAADIIANLQSRASDAIAEDGEGIYLFASEEGGKKSAIELATANGQPQHFELTFKKASAGSKVTIGLEALEATANWVAADNFTLTYYGKDSAREADGDATADPTAIAEMATKTTAVTSIYSISGARLSGLQKGINIVRMSDGSVRKVLVK